MNDSDKTEFSAMMDVLAKNYSTNYSTVIIDADLWKLYFNCLKRYSINDIKKAASRHLRDEKKGHLFPQISDFVTQLEGPKISAEMVIAAARTPKTPFGVLCRSQISKTDVNSLSDFHLKTKAFEVLPMISAWKNKCHNFLYTDHEIISLIKYKVNPRDSFYYGILKPEISVPNADRIKRFTELSAIGQDKQKLFSKSDEIKNSKEQLSNIMRMLSK